jgi:uncharacterized membrane protein YeiB
MIGTFIFYPWIGGMNGEGFSFAGVGEFIFFSTLAILSTTFWAAN